MILKSCVSATLFSWQYNLTNCNAEEIDRELGNVEQRGLSNFKQLSNGTATHVVAAHDPGIANHNGAYLLDCRLAKPEEVRSNAYDPVQAERLWKLSEDIVGQKFD